MGEMQTRFWHWKWSLKGGEVGQGEVEAQIAER